MNLSQSPKVFNTPNNYYFIFHPNDESIITTDLGPE